MAKFSLQTEATTAQDAELAKTLEAGVGHHQDGRLQQAEICYRSVLKYRPMQPDALLGLGAILAQLGSAKEAAKLLERAIKVRPGHADTHGVLAGVYRTLGKLKESLAAFSRAHELVPENFAFHSGLGATLLLANRSVEARDILAAVTARHPFEAVGWSNYATALHRCFDPVAALAAADRAIELAPNLGDAHFARALSLAALERYEEALTAADTALASGAPEANVRFERGVILITLGDFEKGWKEFEWRLPLQRPLKHVSAAPQWRGSPAQVAGRRLLVRAEQGLGDSLQFFRYLPLAIAAGAEVSFEVQAPLLGLMRRSLPTVRFIAQGSPLPACDLQTPLMSLPVAFGFVDVLGANARPYLEPDPALCESWRTRLREARGGLKVGIVCSGNADHAEDRLRSIALAEFRELFGEAANFFLVQRDVRPSDRSELNGLNIADLSAEFRDFDVTAACLKSMDLLISVDTSVAHLAGALGCPVWLLLSTAPDYRWGLGGTKTPWYPTFTLYRQATRGDWVTVLKNVKADLSALVQAGS